MHRSRHFLLVLLVATGLHAGGLNSWAQALEVVEVTREGQRQTVAGRILVEAADGGLLLQASDGQIRALQPEDISARQTTPEEFRPATPDELSEALLQEFPQGFKVHQTEHYLICHNTSENYALWMGGLFERLHDAFRNFWTKRGLKLTEPEFPLVALVFSDQATYARFARGEVGDAVDQIIGYYSFQTNRIITYDLTGAQALRGVQARLGRSATINQVLSHPLAERLVATVIHEATHQLAFNTGLQTRYADNPLWLSEGLAMYFEPPDLRSNTGWRTLGAVNNFRLRQFAQNLPNRPAGRLVQLVSDDKFMRGPQAAEVAYAEAWAFTYFLTRAKQKQLVEYLTTLGQQERLDWQTPETKLQTFQAVFGDLEQLDREFIRYMRQVRPR